MTDEWRSSSLCVSSTDSGRFTDFGEYQDSRGKTDSSYQKCSSFNRFVALNNSQKSHANSSKGVFLRNLNPIPIDPFIDPIFSTCFNCWQFGHGYQECPLPYQHNFCVNCGRMNVLIQFCPRCGRAYDRYVQSKKTKLQEKPVVNSNYYKAKAGHNLMNSMSCSSTSITDSSEEYSYYSTDDNENHKDDVIIDEDKRSNQPSTGKSPSPATEVKDGKSSQQVFSQQVVSRNSDPRSFMIVTRSLLFNDMDPVFFDPELDPPNKACFNCWQPDGWGKYKNKHLHFECPKPKQREFCENCGRQGVDVSTCPRCARGYREYKKSGFRGKYGGSRRKFRDEFEWKRKEMEREKLELDDDCFVFRYKDEACDKVVGVEEDEDYDDIIVDEDERSESLSSTNDTVQEFLSVMDQIKVLSIEDQNDVILKFAKRRREYVHENESA